ncbi:MAG: hypothetical protein QOI06_1667 [Nocardioidaceae bacterium]|jgi:hypothetical protein|nr:hypothetical protein [Nocardioidaceae bacterium]
MNGRTAADPLVSAPRDCEFRGLTCHLQRGTLHRKMTAATRYRSEGVGIARQMGAAASARAPWMIVGGRRVR